MCTLTNAMLREHRISIRSGELFISKDEQGVKRLIRDEMETYSYQFKSAATVFSRSVLNSTD